MATIHLTQCKTYELSAVKTAIHECFDAFGGTKAILATGKRGEASNRVLIKANLVKSAKVEEAATTHPAVIEAVAAAFIAAGAEVCIGDCPAIPQSESAMQAIYQETGLADAAAHTGAVLLYDTTSRTVPSVSGCKAKEFPFWTPLFDADLVVNCAKLKTHSFTTMTGASKNLFGLLPGLLKSKKHAEYMSLNDFCDMLVDLNETAKSITPIFSLIDGIVGMEGKGPTGGTPKVCGTMIASDVTYAADFAASIIMGLKPADVPLLSCVFKRELTPKSGKDYIWSGVSVESCVTPFRLPKHQGVGHMLISAILPEKLKQRFYKDANPYPVINKNKCIVCGKCVAICPVHAATRKGKEISIDYNRCIRCYCCHEVCPERAIEQVSKTIKKNNRSIS